MTTEEILENLSGVEEPIGSIRIYLKNIYATKRFSFGTWNSRQHLIAAVHAGGETGYAESIITVNEPEVSLEGCLQRAESLTGESVSAAITEVRRQRGVWPEHYVEMMEMALVDLAGKLKKRPALELLGLKGTEPVYGVYVILSDDLKDVAAKTDWAVEHGRERYIKVKLFGDNELDCGVIRTVRQHTKGRNTYLIGDVNGGYCMPGEDVPLERIAVNLMNLREAGLNACEDPAYISLNDWVKLQTLAGDLSLIPDYPLRPSRKSVHEILPGMGRIYNIHPDSAGSIIDAVALAGRIRELGAGLMVGDDSLVGPSATIWQQLAVGLGAQWVEATEKDGESEFYYRCLLEIPTDSRINPIGVKPCFGFGIRLDEETLSREADRSVAAGEIGGAHE